MEEDGDGEEEARKMADPNGTLLEHLPSSLLATILSKLDVVSLCSVSATCKTLNACASQAFSFLPAFHLLEVAPTLDLLRSLMHPNPCLRSLKIDCGRLNDSSIGHLATPLLHELCLVNCDNFSGRLLSEVGRKCSELRFLSLSSLAEQSGLSVLLTDLEELIRGCTQLESLCLAFDMSGFVHSKLAQALEAASQRLVALEIGYVPVAMFTELLRTVELNQPSYHVKPPLFPSLQKLCLSVDYITDSLVTYISKDLVSLTHLDLQDAPIMEPVLTVDLTNAGLQQINPRGKLKHLSLVRSQEFLFTYFRRVNDLGVLLMADSCSTLESICLGGFCRVTDTGFRAILHSCSSLCQLRVSHGSQLTDLVFHDISATSLSLTHVSLRWCNLLTNFAIFRLSFNTELKALDLRNCRNLGDESLKALSSLPKLQILLLDYTETSDLGMSYLGHELSSLVSLSVRGCRRLSDNCMSSLFAGSVGRVLQNLDLSRVPNLSDKGIFLLAKSGVALVELRMRECPLIGDAAVMALASMHFRCGCHGSSLQLLDLYEAGGITQLAFRWFKKPYFPRLRWLGVTGCVNRDMVDALTRSRPFLHMACRGEELGTGYTDASCSWYMPEQDEMDELEQWLIEGEDESDAEEMDLE